MLRLPLSGAETLRRAGSGRTVKGEERGDVDVTMPDLDADGEADQGSGASEMSDVQDDDTN